MIKSEKIWRRCVFRSKKNVCRHPGLNQGSLLHNNGGTGKRDWEEGLGRETGKRDWEERLGRETGKKDWEEGLGPRHWSRETGKKDWETGKMQE